MSARASNHSRPRPTRSGFRRVVAAVGRGTPTVLALALLCGGHSPLRAAEAEASTRSRLVFRDRIEPHWYFSNDRFWYRVDLPGDRREFIDVDAVRGERRLAFDHTRLARALAEKSGTAADPEKLPVDRLEFSADHSSVVVSGRFGAWRCDLETYELAPIEAAAPERAGSGAGEQRPQRGRQGPRRDRLTERARAPDGRWEVRLLGHNLVLADRKSDEKFDLTHDAHPASSYVRDASRERLVEMIYAAEDPDPPVAEVFWAPDSQHFVAMRTETGGLRTVYYVESSPPDQLQPRLGSYPYLKPGDSIPVRKPRLFSVGARREIPLDEALFRTPWQISELRWRPDSAEFSFLYNERGHQLLRVVAIDAKTGSARTVLEERSATFIDYAGKLFYEVLDDCGEALWMSERDGWNHLYRYDTRAGKLRNAVTRGQWVVRGVERVDSEKGQVWFRAGGLVAGQDPYHVHYARANLDGTGLTILTEGDGNHSAQWSPDRRYFIDTWSRVDAPAVIELRRSDSGARVCELERADIRSLLETGWRTPERFVAKGRDGATDIFGVIHWPRVMAPGKRYPVIESIYAGPHGAHVPKSFQADRSQSKLADLGFIVVQIDGMGTSQRSKAFHDVCWKNIADAGFPDRIRWLRAAAERHPALDLERVGIYGTSAGAQNALGALLWHGDFYRAGVADSGCHDNRMDKIWWNELWMGWPVGPHYAQQSNVTHAHRLQGKLLLMVGEMDRNVDPSSTMQVVNALVRADKDFEMLVIPGAGHGAARTPYGWRRLTDFFQRHLGELKAQPRSAL